MNITMTAKKEFNKMRDDVGVIRESLSALVIEQKYVNKALHGNGDPKAGLISRVNRIELVGVVVILLIVLSGMNMIKLSEAIGLVLKLKEI